jgi:hypothetical protein
MKTCGETGLYERARLTDRSIRGGKQGVFLRGPAAMFAYMKGLRFRRLIQSILQLALGVVVASGRQDFFLSQKEDGLVRCFTRLELLE